MDCVYFDEINVGDNQVLKKTITEEDVKLFTEVCEDDNPMHSDDEIASESIFRGKIVPGMFLTSLIISLLGENYPGIILLSANFKFIKPVFIGDIVRVSIEVVDKITDKKTVKFRGECTKEHDKIVIEGPILMKLPK